MVNINKNLIQQQQFANLKAGAEAKSSKTENDTKSDKLETLDKAVESGKMTPEEALAELKITDVKVTKSGKNTTISCKIGGRQVSTTVNSADANVAAESLASVIKDDLGGDLPSIPKETAVAPLVGRLIKGALHLGVHGLVHLFAELSISAQTYHDYGTMNFSSVDTMKMYCNNLNVTTQQASLKANVGHGDNLTHWTCIYDGSWHYRRDS